MDYFRFTLTAAKQVGLGLRQQDADADLFLEDGAGTVLASSRASGTTNEWLERTLQAGTYYIRVESQESGTNAFKLRYGVSEAAAQSVNEAPSFAVAGYAFSLAENADGSVTAVALGTVSATDPEGTSLTYSIESGNGSGLFAIDASTGALTYVGTGEDYESDTKTYALTVRASDGSLHGDVAVTVSVTDVEEAQSAQQTVLQTVSEPSGEDLPATTSTTGRVLVGESATGNIGARDDKDWFAVTLEGGTLYRVSLQGSSRGAGTLRDPYLDGIYDSDGNLIPGTANNDGGRRRDSSVSFEPDSDGTYYIAARSNFSWLTGTYRLSVREVVDDYTNDTSTSGTVAVGASATGAVERPGDQDWFAVTFEAGKSYLVELAVEYLDFGDLYPPDIGGIYDAHGSLMSGTADNELYAGISREFFEPETSGTYYIAARGSQSSDIGGYKLSVKDISADVADNTGTSGSVTVGQPVTGEIDYRGDEDWFEVTFESGDVLLD